jgi:hypothetical protein
MVMKPEAMRELLNDELLPAYKLDRNVLDRIDGWMRWKPEDAKTKATSDKEIKYLKEISKTPWAKLVVESTAQALAVEGLYAPHETIESMDPLWAPWDRNDMETKQGAIHRAACGYGSAYTATLPGDTGAVIRAYSPRNMLAVYGDPVEDEYPMYALRVIDQGKGRWHYRIIDEEAVHYLSDENGSLTYITHEVHDMGVTPVVRFANQMDLEGRAPGEVEPLIALFARINKTDYDRMLTQHFNSWKIRTATGVDRPENKAEAAKDKMQLRHEDVLVGEEGTIFGTLDETSMAPFITAHDSDIQALAAASQTPITTFGQLVNISAEGLVEARASLRAKVGDRKKAFGASHVRTLRLAAHAERRPEDAANFRIKAKWSDEETSYISQAVDALGKASQMLGVPPELLWDRIPGVDANTATQWMEHAKSNPSAETRQAAAIERMAVADGPTPSA